MYRAVVCFVFQFAFAVIAFQSAPAQTAPDYRFRTFLYYDTSGGADEDHLSPASWNWTDTLGGSGYSGNLALVGSSTANSVSFNAKAEAERTSGTYRIIALPKVRNLVYVKTPGTYLVSATNIGEGDIDSPLPNSASQAVVSYPFGQHSEAHLSYGITHVDVSTSPAELRTVTCGASPTYFADYPSVAYYPLDDFTSYSSIDLQGSNPASILADINVAYSVAPVSYVAPTAVITGPLVDNVEVTEVPFGTTILIKNESYDGDDATTPGAGICSKNLKLIAPDATSPTSTSGTSLTHTPTQTGVYTIEARATDNEGVAATVATKTFIVSAIRKERGGDGDENENDGDNLDPTCSNARSGQGNGQGSTSSGGGVGAVRGDPNVTADVNPATGNGGVSFSDPVSTRGFPLRFDLRINSLKKFPALTTRVGNANFTYGIYLVPQSVTIAGVSEIRWFLIDSDGAEFDMGEYGGTLVPEAGFFGTLVDNTTSFVLSGAGKPGSIQHAGNFTYTFDSLGTLQSIEDPAGNIQEVAYNGSGYPTSVEDLNTGRIISFEYDTPGLIARVIEGGGEVVTHLEYDSNSLLTQITTKDGASATIRDLEITYTVGDLPYQVTRDGDSASAITFSYVDSGTGRKLANLSYGGGGTNLNYFGIPGSGAVARTVRTNCKGGTVSYDYDLNGDLIRMLLTDFLGDTANPTFTFGYDSNHNMTSYSNGVTNLTMTYNSLGLPLTLSNNASQSWSYAYNGADLTSVSDSIGALVTLAYTDSGNPHSPTSITDGDGNSWTYDYNAFGQLLEATPPTGSVLGSTVYDYEENSSSPDFGYLRTITNGASEVTTFNSYTPLGDALSVSTSPASGVTNTSEFLYDAIRRRISIEHPDGKTVSYDYSGKNLASHLDEAGTQTEFEQNAVSGTLTGIDYPLTKSVIWGLDTDFDVTAFTDGRGKQTAWTYGDNAELDQVTFGDGKYFSYRYFKTGKLKTVSESGGTRQTFSYDNALRVTGINYAASGMVDPAYTYNADDTVSQIVDDTGTRTFTYTDSRLLESVAHTAPSAWGIASSQVVEYAYNPDQTVDTVTWKDGTTTVASWDYSYDLAGRLTSITNNFGETTSYAYDGEGKIVSQTNENDTTTTYSYNQQRGWVTAIEHALLGTAFASYSLEYDAGSNTVGELTEVTELDSSVVTYGYDDLSRLTSEARTGTGSYSTSYEYDLAGNITKVNGSNFATYDDGNKMATLVGGSVSHFTTNDLSAASKSGVFSFSATYDNSRHKIASGAGRTFKYNAEGLRGGTKPTSTAPWVMYVYAGDKVIGEISSAGAQVAYTWGADGLVSQRLLSGTAHSLWHHYGPQGETRQLTNASGAVVNTYKYNAYGLLLSSTGTEPNPHRYGGKYGYYTDTALNAILTGHRWYQPNVMRWTTRDPILFDGGENLYEYVKGNPVRFVDPDGLARRKGRTPPDKWPSPPPNVVGKNPKWNPEGYWEKGKGGTADVVWDPKGHGQPHWDEDTPGGGNRKKKRRWNKAGELLPFNGYCEQEQLDDGRVEEDWLFEIVTGIASGGISPTSIPRLVPKIVPRIPRLVPAW